jgi:TetR/AcrR family transcriptional repressor of bet genes
MARPSNRAERRHTLAVAFGRLLAERGYAGATMAELARASGLRQGLVHYHFESKQEILLALLEHLAHGLEARVAARTTASSTPHQALLAYIDAHVALGDDADPTAVAAWVTLGVEAVRQPEVREAYARAVDAELSRLEALVEAALASRSTDDASPERSAGGAAHRPPAPDARALAAGIYATIQGAYHLASTVPARVPAGFAALVLRQWLGERLPST